ncbi:hypothetical protein ACHAXT_002953 [Thalassiosira profunda]
MCAQDEEFDGLLPSEKAEDALAKRRAAAAAPRGKGYVLLFVLTACVAFAAGWFFSPHHTDISDNLANNVEGENAATNSAHDAHDAEDVAAVEIPATDRDIDMPEPLFNSSFVEYLVSGMKHMIAKQNGTKKYKYESHFLDRWPNSTLPYWAKKTIPFNRFITQDKQVCLVHVGKAGGSTIGCTLGFSLHCDNDNDIKGLLPIVTTHAFHRGVDDCAKNAAYNLFVVRDPLARVLSSFYYERPNMTEDDPFGGKKWHSEMLYVAGPTGASGNGTTGCGFWTLQELAQRGLMNTEKDEQSIKCRARAYNTITGTGRYLTHTWFNYQYYAQYAFRTEHNRDPIIPEGANLLVIRQDHMVDDYNRINQIIGGKSQHILTAADLPRNNAHAKNATEMYLSDDSKSALCRALCNEIQVYKQIIRSAINLNDADVQDALEKLMEVCPKEAAGKDCHFKRPDMRRKIEGARGALP